MTKTYELIRLNSSNSFYIKSCLLTGAAFLCSPYVCKKTPTYSFLVILFQGIREVASLSSSLFL